MITFCSYCGRSGERGTCEGCGAPFAGAGEQKREPVTIGPMFYMGYMVYRVHSETFVNDRASFLFFAGDRLVETIVLDLEVLRQFVSEGESYMPFVYHLLELAQGEVEVLRIKEQNVMRPALFEIRYARSAEDEYSNSVNVRDLSCGPIVVRYKEELLA